MTKESYITQWYYLSQRSHLYSNIHVLLWRVSKQYEQQGSILCVAFLKLFTFKYPFSWMSVMRHLIMKYKTLVTLAWFFTRVISSMSEPNTLLSVKDLQQYLHSNGYSTVYVPWHVNLINLFHFKTFTTMFTYILMVCHLYLS